MQLGSVEAEWRAEDRALYIRSLKALKFDGVFNIQTCSPLEVNGGRMIGEVGGGRDMVVRIYKFVPIIIL